MKEMHRLTRIEKRIVRRLRDHQRFVGAQPKDGDGSSGHPGDGECWHRGWRTGYGAALYMVASGVAGRTARESAIIRKAARRWVRRTMEASREP